MISTYGRRFAVATVLAGALVGGGLPALTGVAHAATITPTPNAVSNDGEKTIVVKDATAPFLVSSATLTKSDDSTVKVQANNVTSTTTTVTATFPLLNALPGSYDLSLGGGLSNSCSACVTVTGLPPTMQAYAPTALAVGDPDRSGGLLRLVNPSRGSKYTNGRIQLNFTGVAGLQKTQLLVWAANASATMDPVDLEPDGSGGLTGYVGPTSGSVVNQGQTVNIPLQFQLASGAPGGKLYVEAVFGTVAGDGTLANSLASATTTMRLSNIPKGAEYFPVAPTRLLDTRVAGQGPIIAPGQTRTLTLPAAYNAASAVAINLTSTAASAVGTVAVFPTGATLDPSDQAADMVYRPARNLATLVTTPVSAGHQISIHNYNTGASVHVVIDLEGYYVQHPSTQGSTYTPTTPTRVLDTRTAKKIVYPGQTVLLDEFSGFGVPANASAVAVNITVVSPSKGGHVTAYPKSTPEPTASTLNFPAGGATPNLAIVALKGSPPGIIIRNDSAGTLHLVVDLAGWFTPDGSGSTFHPVTLQRMFDTRNGDGGITVGPIPSGATRTVTLANRAPVPGGGATFAHLNLTVVSPASSGWLVAYPADSARPLSSMVNFTAGQNIANLGFVKLPASGQVSFYNGSPNTIQLVVDLEGWGATP